MVVMGSKPLNLGKEFVVIGPGLGADPVTFSPELYGELDRTI